MPATCSSSYARLSAAFPGLHVTAGTPPRGPGWVGAAELARGGPELTAFIAGDADRLTGEHGRTPRPDVAAGLALHRYLWPACLLFTVPWFLHRRVPRLPVEDVAFHPATGRFAVDTRQLTGLLGDPVLRGPGRHATVRTEDALRGALRAALAEHLTPVLRGFAPHVRRGPRTLWRNATDEVAEGLWYIARLLGEEDRAVAELRALLPAGARFGTGGSAASRAPGGPARTRLTCCLFYTVSPSGTCAGCPRATDGPRLRHPAHAG
ncbi:(2Fe-2S)-binding protein [Actinacidiphila acidipaludis]|uniref:(2Fe-2S)-binding protein n=1 Tax=Actinacidiphila acidipaludis TaxID=2873382 RepID=A0ABS7Q5K5_9ACTN|nr:(2Fe-2S)-binding protein [Streptomyces acidipaludis]MBY8878436.1 (2Fe-2S)-binding protein [Streptomyces acidipaludis]